MRKKTVNHLADTLFWYLLYFLPVLGFLIILATKPDVVPTFSLVFETLGLDVVTTGTIYTSLDQIFGATGILPLFTSTSLLQFFTYYVSVMIAHLFVDFLLFIPRLGHKWLNKFCQGDD